MCASISRRRSGGTFTATGTAASRTVSVVTQYGIATALYSVKRFVLELYGVSGNTKLVTTRKRSADQTATAISLPKSLLREIDERSEKLGITRSAYLCALARADLARRGSLVLSETPTSYGVSSEPAEPGSGRDPHSDTVLNDTLAPHLGSPRKPKRGS